MVGHLQYWYTLYNLWLKINIEDQYDWRQHRQVIKLNFLIVIGPPWNKEYRTTMKQRIKLRDWVIN